MFSTKASPSTAKSLVKERYFGDSYEDDSFATAPTERPDILLQNQSLNDQRTFKRKQNYDNPTLEPFLANGQPSPTISSSHSSAFRQQQQLPSHTLTLSTTLEANDCACTSVPKLWGMVQLDAVHNNLPTTKATSIDFVVIIDHSSSMRIDNKLAFVQATIEYMLSQLSEVHRFCLIMFNQQVTMLTDGLLVMTPSNKQLVLELLRGTKPEGSTNISDALFTGISVLKSRLESEQSRLSSIMLFTDGLANIGLRGSKFLRAMKEMSVPQGLTINTFGYGLDHDSQMLQNISFCSKGGVYYYIETVESIAATFGECLAGLLSTVAHNIHIRLVGQDGCRIVSFYTKYPIIEHKNVKDYTISLGSMYSQESKTVLFKLSLRKMEELLKQQLLQVIISYTNTLTGVDHKLETTMNIGRPSHNRTPTNVTIPVQLDKHINRYAAAAAIEEAVAKATLKDFYGARKQIEDVIYSVQNSVSGRDSKESQYCEDLVKDLYECMCGMENNDSFVPGVHYAHAFATMYYMERSTGTSNLLGIENVQRQFSNPTVSSSRNNNHNDNHSKNFLRFSSDLSSFLQHAHSHGDDADLLNAYTNDDRVQVRSKPGKNSGSMVSPNSNNKSTLVEKKRNQGYGYVTNAQEEESSRAVRGANEFVNGYLENAL